MTDNLTPETPRETLLAERAKGNVCFLAVYGLHVAPLKDFVAQPVDGLLYDLNRLEEVALTFLGKDPQWVNNFAVALVVRELKAQLAAALREKEALGDCLGRIVRLGAGNVLTASDAELFYAWARAALAAGEEA